jgi:hypothetical protein
LDLPLVRPSRRVADAFRAAPAEVFFDGALRCDIALPAADFDLVAVDASRMTLDDFDAAFLPVSLATERLAGRGCVDTCNGRARACARVRARTRQRRGIVGAPHCTAPSNVATSIRRVTTPRDEPRPNLTVRSRA